MYSCIFVTVYQIVVIELPCFEFGEHQMLEHHMDKPPYTRQGNTVEK